LYIWLSHAQYILALDRSNEGSINLVVPFADLTEAPLDPPLDHFAKRLVDITFGFCFVSSQQPGEETHSVDCNCQWLTLT
jgi:hypothetical protein